MSRSRRRLRATRAALVALALVCAGLALRPRVRDWHLDRRPLPPGSGRIVRVVDGDTVVVRIAGQDETARLLGVDTPETVKPGAPVDCFGPEASHHTTSLLPAGTVVRLRRDREGRDRYGRLLVYLWRAADDRFVNLDLVAGGWARPLSISPNTTHASTLAVASARARAAGAGLWGRCPAGGRAPPGGR